MSEHCLHEQELGAVQNSVGRLEKEIFGNGKDGLSQTVPALSAKIDVLIDTVGDLRTAVSAFARFEAGYKAEQSAKNVGFEKTLKIMGLVVAFCSMLIAFIIMQNKTKNEVRDMIDQYSYDMHTRGLNDTIQ
jgi:phage-related protein